MSGVAQVPETPTIVREEIGWAVDWQFSMASRNTSLIPELSGLNALYTFHKMRLYDETIGAMLWVMFSTLTQMPWTFVPCKNGQELSREDPDYDQALTWSDFAQSCLDDMDHSWGDHLEEAMTMTWAGFAPCEINFKKRDGEASKYSDGKWGFKSLPLRDQFTIYQFDTDDRNELSVMQQRTMDGKSAPIPIWKVLHYRMTRVLNNPWGESMLTNAHRVWKLKQKIQDSEAIGIDRELCGLPTFRLPNEEITLANKTDSTGKPTNEALAARARITAAMQAVTNMRFNEIGGLVIPSDHYENEDGTLSSAKKYDFEIVKSAGQRAIDARSAARDYDRALARTMLMQFLHLGDRSGGSFGLSEDQSSIAIRSMKALAIKITDEFNLKAVPLLWLMNSAPKEFMPRLASGQPTEAALDKLGGFLRDLGMAEPLFQNDPALRDGVLDMAGIRHARQKIREVPAKPPAPAQPDLFGFRPALPPPAATKAIAKRDLMPNADGKTAKSPFLYDPNALATLRPDQVPRFFDALTNPERYPVKTVPMAGLHAMQDRVDPTKVEAMRGGAAGGKKPVVVRHNGKDYIADGHHRLTADWMNGAPNAEVHYKDLEAVDTALKSA